MIAIVVNMNKTFFKIYPCLASLCFKKKNLKRSRLSRIKILTRRRSREPHKNDAVAELLVPLAVGAASVNGYGSTR
jgi:hypothetical protein